VSSKMENSNIGLGEFSLLGPTPQQSCWRQNRTKIRPELTFPLTHTMPL
jgi:hypothetical protein